LLENQKVVSKKRVNLVSAPRKIPSIPGPLKGRSAPVEGKVGGEPTVDRRAVIGKEKYKQ